MNNTVSAVSGGRWELVWLLNLPLIWIMLAAFTVILFKTGSVLMHQIKMILMTIIVYVALMQLEVALKVETPEKIEYAAEYVANGSAYWVFGFGCWLSVYVVISNFVCWLPYYLRKMTSLPARISWDWNSKTRAVSALFSLVLIMVLLLPMWNDVRYNTEIFGSKIRD